MCNRLRLAVLIGVWLCCACLVAQQAAAPKTSPYPTTPHLKLEMPPQGTFNWNEPINNNFMVLDSYIGGTTPLPNALTAPLFNFSIGLQFNGNLGTPGQVIQSTGSGSKWATLTGANIGAPGANQELLLNANGGVGSATGVLYDGNHGLAVPGKVSVGGTLTTNTVTAGPQNPVPSSWIFDWTTPVTAFQSLAPTDWIDKTAGCQVYRGQINVRDCGAKGDGSTVDQAAIVKAHQSICAAGGGAIFYAPGTYIIDPSSGPFYVCSHLREYGPGATLKVKNGEGDYYSIFQPQNSCTPVNTTTCSATGHPLLVDITFDGFILDQNIMNGTGVPTAPSACTSTPPYYGCYQWGIFFSGDKNGMINGLTVSNMTFYASGVNTVVATDGKSSGVPSTYTANVVISNNKVIFTKRPAVTAFDNSAFYIDAIGATIHGNIISTANNSISDGGTTAYEMHGGPLTVTGNKADFYRLGGYIVNAANGSIFNSNIITHANQGFQIYQASNIDGVSFISNQISINNADRFTALAQTNPFGIVTGSTFTGTISNIRIASNIIEFQQDTADKGTNYNPWNMGGISLLTQGTVANASIENNTVINSLYSCIAVGGGSASDSTIGFTTNVIVANNLLIDCGTLPYNSNAYDSAIQLNGKLDRVRVYNNHLSFTTNPFAGKYAIAGSSVASTGGSFVGNNPVLATNGTPLFAINASMSQAFDISPQGLTFNGTAPANQIWRCNGTVCAPGAMQSADLPAGQSIRAGSWTISSATSISVTFSPAFPTGSNVKCTISPIGSTVTTGAPWIGSVNTTSLLVGIPNSGSLQGFYICAVGNTN